MTEIETKLFDGRAYAQEKLDNLSERVARLKEKGVEIKIASIFLTADKGSVLYTNIKKKDAEMIGVTFEAFGMEEKDTQKIISIIQRLNNDQSFQGILVQKPSGKNGFSDQEWVEIISALNPKKDVDGLTHDNLGYLLSTGTPAFIPATVRAVLEIIDASKFNPRGKKVVIIGSSVILGKPLSIKLIDRKASVTVLNDESEDIPFYTTNADLIVTATGCPGIIGKDDIKEGVVLIDVSSPKGDVRKEEIMNKAAFYTPVPGGVGPVTVACLLENLVESVEKI